MSIMSWVKIGGGCLAAVLAITDFVFALRILQNYVVNKKALSLRDSKIRSMIIFFIMTLVFGIAGYLLLK